jgi:phosphoglycolate phosphatase
LKKKVRKIGNKYTTVLFDLDGTLTDPQVGITKSVQYALQHMGIEESELGKLIHFIGPPLTESFREWYGMSNDQAKQAVQYYREYFSKTGIFENGVYAGIPELLTQLARSGKVLAVATSKPEIFANRILQYFSLAEHFSVVAGSNLDGTRVEKMEVIAYALQQLPPVNARNVLMVGDRKHDVLGARANGIDSLAVGYGYGTQEELFMVKPTYFAKTVADMINCMI